MWWILGFKPVIHTEHLELVGSKQTLITLLHYHLLTTIMLGRTKLGRGEGRICVVKDNGRMGVVKVKRHGGINAGLDSQRDIQADDNGYGGLAQTCNTMRT